MCLPQNHTFHPPTISECQLSYISFITFRYKFLGHVVIQETDKYDDGVSKSLYAMVAGGDGLSIFQSKKKVIFGHMKRRYRFISIY